MFSGVTPLHPSRAVRLQQHIKRLSGLVAYYPLTESSGVAVNRAPDTYGTLPGTVTGATQGVDGLVGRAYSFDGVNDNVAAAGVINSHAQKTILGFFFSTTSTYRAFSISGLGEASGQRLTVTTSSTVQLELTGTAGGVRITTGANTYAGSWNMVAITTPTLIEANARTGSDGKIYIWGPNASGLQSTTSGNIGGTGGTRDALYLGSMGASAGWFAGRQQHIAVFNRELTEAELQRIARVAGLA